MSKYTHEIYLRDKEKIAKRNKKWRQENPDKVRKIRNIYQTNLYKTSEEYRALKKKIAKDWYENNKERALKNVKEWSLNNRDKVKKYSKDGYHRNKKTRERVLENVRKSRLGPKGQARLLLAKAIRNKVIIKPNNCSSCNRTNERIQGHHPDYSKPLEVVWLCGPCHGLIHTD